MTLKTQEQLFTKAIAECLQMKDILRVMSYYLHLRDEEKRANHKIDKREDKRDESIS